MSNCSLKQVEEELLTVYEFCKQQKLTDPEIRQLFAPILGRRSKSFKKIILALIALLVVMYLLTYVDFFSWHFSAVGRILMIKILPYYDWQSWKNEDCLIKRNVVSEKLIPDCYYCETIEKVSFATEYDANWLKNKYLDHDIPVLLDFEMDNDNITLKQILDDDYYSNSLPCRIASNLKLSGTVADIVRKLEISDKYFVHFLNCDFEAVKQFRKFITRPLFFADEISPIQYSWVLSSSKYTGGRFKNISLRDKIAAFLQFSGDSLVMLKPLESCSDQCTALEFYVHAGEALMLSSYWDLEYKPASEGDHENFAVILEAH